MICQLDILCSDGRIEDSVIDSDGRVFHEHVCRFCTKVQLGCIVKSAFPCTVFYIINLLEKLMLFSNNFCATVRFSVRLVKCVMLFQIMT